MGRDLRHAVQALSRTRGFTLAATLALGLAIGANATIFGLVDGLWLRPPGVPRSSELTRVFATTETSDDGLWSFPEYEEIARLSAFSGVVAKGGRGSILFDPSGSTELLLVNVVSLNFFTVLGVAAEHGGVFSPADDAALRTQPGVVLGHAFWQRRFGGDPAIVGRTITFGRSGHVLVTVLGVLPRSFRELEPDLDRDVWMPPATWERLTNRSEFTQRDYRWFSVVARRMDTGVAAAQDEMTALAASMARDHPAISAGRGARVISDARHRLERGGVNAGALLGLVLLVVLITCVNLAHLILARAAARTREIATRVALGAGRWRVMRQMIAESIVLGALGAAAGLIVAMWVIRVLPAILPQPPGFAATYAFQVDGRVLGFTIGITAVTILLFGLVPSWVTARGDVATLIKTASAAPGSGRRGRVGGAVFVISQVALSLVLLSAAAVLARSFAATRTADIGIERKAILTAWSSMDVDAARAAEGVTRLEALPGVTRVAVAIRAPLSLSGGGRSVGVYLPDSPPLKSVGAPQVKFNAVSANYFDTIGTRAVRGRLFTDADQRPGEPVVIVNQAFADRFFPGQDAVDRVIRLRGGSGPLYRIIGVVENAVVVTIDDKDNPYLYLPFWRQPAGEITYFVEAAAGASLTAAVREALKSVHASLEPRRVIAMADYIDFAGASYRATATLALALGCLGLVLTAIGVYGVVSYHTSRRTREIGVRVALGAAPSGIIRLVLRDGARATAIGIAVGLPLSFWMNWLLEPLLLWVTPWDGTAFAAAALVIGAAVLAATLVPALRAMRVSPATALRTE